MTPSGTDLFDHRRLRELFERAEQEVVAGRLPSCQLAVGRDHQVVTAAFGSATTESRYVIFSVTKALVAATVWTLMGDRGPLRPQTRIADVIDEFARDGTAAITLEHLLTHTAGLPHAPMRPEEGATAEGRATRFATWRVEYEPGTRAVYHPTSAHWVLADVIERVTGEDYRHVVAARVTAPLRLDPLRLGVPADEQHDIIDVVVTDGDPTAVSGLDLTDVVAEAAPQRLLRYNEPPVRAIGVPGAGAVGTATDVVRLFQAMLHGNDRVWSPEVLADATGTIRCRLVDPLTKVPVNRSLGLIIAGDDGNAWLRDLGRSVGPRAFVVSGIGGQVAWADPDSGLSYCFLTNAIDADVVRSFLRSSELSTLAGRCAPDL